MAWLVSFIPRAVVQGIPLLFGSTGETLTEKSGNLNLGIPGVMYVGGISGVIGAFFYDQSVRASATVDGVLDNALYISRLNPVLSICVPFFSCLLGALLMGLLYCFLTVTLRANQNVTGLALTTFGVGIGNFFGGSLIKLSGSAVPSIALTNISAYFHNPILYAPWQGDFGKVFLSYGWLAYLAIAVALAASYVLRRTRMGLHLRAVGENPATADAAGIHVAGYKYGATCIGSMIAGLGGLYYVMDYASGVWSNNAFGDRGWLAIALVIFTIWRPNVGVLASFLFGGLYILHMYIPTGTNLAVKELYKMAPYVVTLLVLILTSLRNQREKQPPQHLGLPYFREER
ncbi:MAG: ABC transporter permease [Clostridia bacterium]|nr:ABC transporter permease [Clostridia bacterium]